jgi:hypothetical protein
MQQQRDLINKTYITIIMSKDKKKTPNPDGKKKVSDYQTSKIKLSKVEILPLKKTATGK